MSPHEQVRLPALMALTSGAASVRIGLIDGPVAAQHADLAGASIQHLGGGACAEARSSACLHGTFVAGILCASRDAQVPGICPGSTLVSRPVFPERSSGRAHTSAAELSAALQDVLRAGVRVINLSLTTFHPSPAESRELGLVLDRAAAQGVLVVVAAGNQGTLGSTVLSRHPWAIPIVAYGAQQPIGESNLGRSIGTRGLGAPGDQIRGLRADGGTFLSGGTSAAAPFVTGTIALLLSLVPAATGPAVRQVLRPPGPRSTVVPPLLDAWAAYQSLKKLLA